MTPSIRAAAAALAALLCAASASGAGGPVPGPGPASKAQYRIFVLTRDPAKDVAAPDHADPIYGLMMGLRERILALGAKQESDGKFDTVKPDSSLRENQLTIYTVSWTADELEQARKSIDSDSPLIQVRIEPAAGAAHPVRRGARDSPPSADEQVAAQVALALKIPQKLPPSLFSGKRQPWDGGESDSVVADMTGAAARLGVPVAALPPASEASRRLKLSPPVPPVGPGQTAPVPSPATTPGRLQYDAFVVDAAAKTHVDADVLRALMFASEGYHGGFKSNTGLYGPMGLSPATGRDYGLARAQLSDPQANILVAAQHIKKLQEIFGGDLSRAVAAFYCGSGNVRASGGIPPGCVDFLGKFRLAYQNGAAWAVNHDEPRNRPPVVPEGSVSAADAVARAAHDKVMEAIKGQTEPNQPWHSKKIPDELLTMIGKAVSDNYYDKFYGYKVSLEPALMIGLVYAEGGWDSLNDSPNEWLAIGATQVTRSGALPHCKEPLLNRKTKRVVPDIDWAGISARHSEKNVQCGAKTLFDRINDISDERDPRKPRAPVDPIVGLALYNTQSVYWDAIRSSNKIPTIVETITHTMRAAHVYCALTGVQPLTPSSYRTAAAAKLAKYAERVTVLGDFEADHNPYTKSCLVFK